MSSRSGRLMPRSHFDTAWKDTPSRSASSLWLRRLAFRRRRMVSDTFCFMVCPFPCCSACDAVAPSRWRTLHTFMSAQREHWFGICEKNKRGHSYNLLYKPNRGYDEDEFVCGKDNYVFGKFDYENEEDCKEALKELECGEMEVSTRSGLGISLLRVKRA